MSKKHVAYLVAAVCLAGCASSKNNLDAEKYVFSSPPTQASAEISVPAYFENVLIDPFTAHYKYGQPYKAWLQAGLIYGGGIQWEGWAIDVAVDAKNRMGGYTGWQAYHVVFTGDKVVNAYPADSADFLWHQIP